MTNPTKPIRNKEIPCPKCGGVMKNGECVECHWLRGQVSPPPYIGDWDNPRKQIIEIKEPPLKKNHTTVKEEWEERFDNSFDAPAVWDKKGVKAFIRTLLQSERERVVLELRLWARENAMGQSGVSEPFICLSDLLTKLKI